LASGSGKVQSIGGEFVVVKSEGENEMKKSGILLVALLFVLMSSFYGSHVVQATASSEVSVDTGNGFGSTGTFALRFTNTDVSTGTAITYSQSAVNGDSFTINSTGIYGISYTDGTPSGDNTAISVNLSGSSSVTGSTPPANVLCRGTMGANESTSCSVTTVLTSGDVIRAHRSVATDGGTNVAARFIIVKVG
jgi:hypothetical protein